jgi:formylglycine-generating enzyme required for sulfatase activity
MSAFDPYHKWLGIPKAEQPPHHYRLLGIAPFEADPEVIEAAADRQMAYIRQCATGPYTRESQQILNELSAARVCLLNAAKKQAYDRELKSRLAPAAPPITPPPAAGPSSPAPGDGADNALLLLQQSVADAEAPAARRPAPKKKRGAQPSTYWLWGSGAAALLVVGGVIYAVSQPGPAAVQPAGKTTAGSTEKPARKAKKDRPTAERNSISDDPAIKKSDAPAAKEAITNSIGMKLVLVPAGEFQMGADESQAETLKAFPYTATNWLAGERPRHRVRITRAFYMGTCEVTVGEFMKYYEAAGGAMEEVKGIPVDWDYDPNRPDRAQREVLPWAPGWVRIDEHPVVLVSWNDANAFCQWLSQKEGKNYRLPTEAEWEYACRAGTATRYWCGNDPDELTRYANIPDRETKNHWPGAWMLEVRDGKQTQNRASFPFVDGTDGYALTAPVGNYPPNAFGLCDMHGNVNEWCRDWYDVNSYSQPEDDPQGPSQGSQRVIRGGGWRSYPVQARAAYRSGIDAAYRDNQLGFRVVCETGAAATGAPAQPAAKRPLTEDLLKRISLEQNTVRGSWRFDGTALVSPATELALLQIPVTPAENYILRATVEATSIADCLSLGLTTGSTQVTVVCNGWRNTTSGLQLVDGHLVPDNETETGPVLLAGKPNEIVCRVTRGRVEVTCNGKLAVNWSGDFNRLAAGPDWEPPNKRQLYLGTHLTSYRLSKLELEPLAPDSTTSTPPPPQRPLREVVGRLLQLKADLSIRVGESLAWTPVKSVQDLPERASFRISNLVLQDGAAGDLRAVCSLPIEQLTLKGSKITDDHLAALAGAQGPELLAIEDSSATDRGLQHLARCAHLKWLNLIRGNFTPGGWRHLQRVPELVSIFATGGGVSDAHVAALGGHPKLEKLYFANCRVSGAGWRALRGTPKLNDLTFTNCPLDADGIRAIADNLPELTRFFVSTAPLTDGALEPFRKLNQLEVFSAHQIDITDAGLAIVGSSGRLTHLDLSFTPVWGTGFRDLKGKLMKLESCNLASTRLNDPGLRDLAAAAPQLQSLFLQGTQISDAGLESLTKFTALRNAFLMDTRISEQGLKHLKELRGLQNLQLPKAGFKSAALEELRKALPNCNVTIQ